MTIYDEVFPLGLGTNRFSLGAVATNEEIDSSAEIVLRALDMGVNYIDTAMSYSGGHASEVLKRALRQTKIPYRITSKLTSRLKTADAARRAVEEHLTALGINRVSDLMVWSIFNFAEFEDIMRPGGIYDGALKLKEEGIAEHIYVFYSWISVRYDKNSKGKRIFRNNDLNVRNKCCDYGTGFRLCL